MTSVWLIIEPYGYLGNLSYVNSQTDFNSYYLEDTSGVGIDEVRRFLEEKAEKEPIFVGVRLDSGNPESAIFSYYGPKKNPNIQAVCLDELVVEIPKDLNFLSFPLTSLFCKSKHDASRNG